MVQEIHDFRLAIAEFLEGLGLDPVYVVFAIVLMLALSQWRRIKSWKALGDEEKSMLRILLFAVAATAVAAIMRLAGAF